MKILGGSRVRLENRAGAKERSRQQEAVPACRLAGLGGYKTLSPFRVVRGDCANETLLSTRSTCMTSRYRFFRFIALAAVLLPSLMPADVVDLKSGEHMEGTFRQAGIAGVVMEVSGRVVTIPLAQVEAIRFSPPAGPRSPLALEALDAIRGLRSVVKSGIAYRDYAPRVLDARVRVDRYLGSPDSPAEARLRAAAAAAMEYYALASKIWNASVTNDTNSLALYASVGTELRENLRVNGCKGTRAILGLIVYPGSTANTNLKDLGTAIGSRAEDLRSALWQCAETSVNDADRLVK